MQVGQITAELSLEMRNFNQGLTEAEQQFKTTEKAFDGFKEVGKGVTAVGVGIAAGIGYAVDKAADFEQALSNVKAVSGETSDNMGKLSALALQMGADTKYSATEAANGIEELVKAGVSTKDILGGGLAGALNLATAGELELADAAEIASTVLNAFKADGLSVAQAGDILAGAANASATSVQEMKLSLAACSSVASSVGFSFKDTTTALALFAQNGLKGSDAGTSLKSMLMNLQPQTDAQTKLMKELGLMTKDGANAFFDAKGHLKSLDEISNVLTKSMGGLTDQQRLAKMETLFGSDAIRAANILYKEGSKGADEMADSISKIKAADVAAEKMDNLKGKIEQFKGSMETAEITAGNVFLPIVSGIVDWATNLTNKFGELSPGTQKLTLEIIAAAGAIALIGGPMLMLIGFIPSIVAGFTTIAGVAGVMWTAITGPVGLVVLAVAAIGLALYGMASAWGVTMDGIKKALSGAVNWVVKGLNFLIQGLNHIPGVNIGLIGGISMPAEEGTYQRMGGASVFHTGGTFRSGNASGEGPAWLRDGERVVPRGGNTYNVNVYGNNSISEDSLLRSLRRAEVAGLV